MTKNEALSQLNDIRAEVARLEDIKANSDDETERLAAETCLEHQRSRLAQLEAFVKGA